jgi:hypothetical protein
MFRRRILTAALVVFTALVVTYAAAGAARSERATDQTKTIAAASTSDFRLELTATRQADPSGAPTATVRLAVSKRAGSGWRRTAVRPLSGGPYFWHTVTGPLAVCSLEIRTTAAKPGFAPHAVVQLLRSPSLGCGPAARFPLR